mmetsp:Transcript_93131/g.208463  ORF Transcript_93131/g.208463 Transcript_93131/m.208463 type:complete len:269 (+) Transcript_93131:47-853(+)
MEGRQEARAPPPRPLRLGGCVHRGRPRGLQFHARRDHLRHPGQAVHGLGLAGGHRREDGHRPAEDETPLAWRGAADDLPGLVLDVGPCSRRRRRRRGGGRRGQRRGQRRRGRPVGGPLELRALGLVAARREAGHRGGAREAPRWQEAGKARQRLAQTAEQGQHLCHGHCGHHRARDGVRRRQAVLHHRQRRRLLPGSARLGAHVRHPHGGALLLWNRGCAAPPAPEHQIGREPRARRGGGAVLGQRGGERRGRGPCSAAEGRHRGVRR